MYFTPKESASLSSLREKRMLTRLPTIAATAAARCPSPRSSDAATPAAPTRIVVNCCLARCSAARPRAAGRVRVPRPPPQPRLVLEMLKEARRDEDLASGKRERVDGPRVAQHVKCVLVLRSSRVASRDDLLPDARDFLLDQRI